MRRSGGELWEGYPVDPIPPWLMPWAQEADLQIPANLKNNVVFLGVMEQKKFRPKATAFFVGFDTKFGGLLHLVTAEHVIVGLQLKGHKEVFVRTNIEGFPTTPLPLDKWTFHPDAERNPADVAVIPITLLGTTKADFLVMQPEAFVTPKNIADREWGVGDEIVVIGLFRNHYGHTKNIPLVRIGSLAALPEEPVKTKWGFIEAYLIEMHSIGGLSGSPVYIHHPPFRITKDGKPQIIEGARLNLLGIMQGHFDIPNLREDSIMEDDDDGENGSINTGVGVVVPAHKILETLNHPDLVAERDTLQKRTERNAARLDFDDDDAHSSAASEVSVSDANPNHLKDFTRLVDVAARKRPQGDQT